MFGVQHKPKTLNEDEGEGLLDAADAPTLPTQEGFRLHSTITIISLSLNVFVIFLGLFYLTHKSSPTRRASYENGFDSDLGQHAHAPDPVTGD